MDKSMIMELLHNGNDYEDTIKLSENKEYRKSNDNLYKLCENLCKDMSDEEKREILNKIYFAHSEAEIIATEEYFKAGFKLGLMIGAQNFLD